MSLLQNYLVALYATALSVLILAIFVYLRSPQKTLNKAFAFYSVCIAIWSFGQALHISATDMGDAVFWARFFHGGVCFISTGFVHFALALTNQQKNKNSLIKGLYVTSSIFFLLNLSNLIVAGAEPKFALNYYWTPGPVYPGLLLFWMGSVCYGLAVILKGYRSTTGSRKDQLTLLFWASLFGYLGGISNYLPAFNIHFYPYNPYGTYAVPIYSLVVAYAITRYRFMDINIVIKRTAVYSLSAGVLTGLFIVLVLAITNVFSMFAQVSSFKVSIFVAILIAILFNPLRNRIQTMIDRVFYKKTYDYYATIQQVSSRLASIFDVQNIYAFIGDTIFDVMALKSVHLLAAGAGSGYEMVYHTSRKGRHRKDNDQSDQDTNPLKIGSRSGLVSFFRKSGDIVVKDELLAIEANVGGDTVEKIKNDLALFDGEAAVPVMIDGRLSLLIILGERLSGDIFINEDINLLNTIAHQTAIALKNAGLYKEKIDSERLASIGMMSATFAHEIRNPLTSLKTFAQLMPEKYNDEEFRDTFSKIVEGEIERIDGLIGNLLDFSSEKKPAYFNEFNLVDLVGETVRYVENKMEIERRTIEIEKKYTEDEIPMTGDAEKLKQMFINILMNGCQAMNGEGVLTVKMHQNSKYVDVSITDTGKGIPPGDISKIFDPFVTTKEMGVGLGLAISKRIIEDHNGKVKVRSTVSKGSTFTISLPVQN